MAPLVHAFGHLQAEQAIALEKRQYPARHEPLRVVRILNQLDLPATPPPIAHARAPPLHDADQTPAVNPAAPETLPQYEFDQTVSW